MSVQRPKKRAGKRTSSKRVSRAKQLPLLQQHVERRRWLRAAAYVMGAFVLLAHIYTFATPSVVKEMFQRSIRDVIFHSAMFAVFTAAFRFSLVDEALGGTKLRPADLTALVVCCGWGALCEVLQLFIPGREFRLSEMALNVGVPVIVIALISLSQRD